MTTATGVLRCLITCSPAARQAIRATPTVKEALLEGTLLAVTSVVSRVVIFRKKISMKMSMLSLGS
jgi:hypothetical protein